MFSATPADAYHKAIKALPKAELAHRKNLDRLHEARAAHQAHQVTAARRDCEASERALQDALQTAADAHRSYWTQRRDALRDELRAVAVLLAEYNAIAHCAGDRVPHPAQRFLQTLEIEGHTAANVLQQGVLLDPDGIPHESPDCELLEDELGRWRP